MDPIIRDVRVHYLSLDSQADFGEHMSAFAWEVLLIRLQTGDGQEGWSQPTAMHGEARSVGQFILHVLKPMLIGEDARFPERIYRKLLHGLYALPKSAVWPVDIAVWDLAGKLAGVPVYQMLGACRDTIPAYASTPALPSAQAYADFARDLLDQRFTAIKLHGHGEPTRDVEACEAVRDAVGPDVALMLDVVGAYGHDRRAAVDVGRALERLRFEWYEHPLAENDIPGYRDVCAKLEIPVAGPDGLLSPDDMYAFLAAEATDIVRPNAEFQGGLTGQRKVAHVAESLRVRCEPHTHGSVISQHANLHGVCGIPSCRFFELPVPLGMLDVMTRSVIRPDASGCVSVPEGPGLGVDLDLDEVENGATELVA